MASPWTGTARVSSVPSWIFVTGAEASARMVPDGIETRERMRSGPLQTLLPAPTTTAVGHERRFRYACDTSAYPPRADVNARNIYLAYGMVRQHSRGRGAQSLQGGAQSLQEVRAMTMAAANWQGLIREPELRLSTLAE